MFVQVLNHTAVLNLHCLLPAELELVAAMRVTFRWVWNFLVHRRVSEHSRPLINCK